MDHQLSFADSEFNNKRHQTRKEKFLGRMEKLIPWHVAEIHGKIKELKKHPRINKLPLKNEYLKAIIRATVEHPFRIIKCQFGFTKARYRGLVKNDSKLAMRLLWQTLLAWIRFCGRR